MWLRATIMKSAGSVHLIKVRSPPHFTDEERETRGDRCPTQGNTVWAEGKPMVAVPIVPIEGITQGSRNTEVR